MLNIKKISKKSKTLKNSIHNYISKKQDICCENNINRKIVFQIIVKKYKQICKNMDEPDEYLSYINNDLLLFIGYYVDLEKNKDIEGMKLWNKINKKTYEHKNINEQKIEKLLQDAPLYFLLSFLGYASYREMLAIGT